MRSKALIFVATALGCGAAPAPAEAPVVTIAPVAEAAPSASASGSAAPAEVASAAPASSATADARAAQLAKEASQIDVAILGSLGGGVPIQGSLTSTAPPGQGVAIGGIAPGAAPPPAMNGQASIGQVSLKGGSVSNALAVAAGMAAGFRRCYRKGLKDDPSMQGSVTMVATIGQNGEVLSVSPSRAKGLAGTVISCVAARVSSAQFAPPDRSPVTVTIPVTLSPAP